MLIRARRVLRIIDLGAEVVTGGEHRPVAAEDDDAHVVVGLRLEERLAEFDEQTALLRVALIGTVEHDPGDGALVEGLVRDEAVVSHESHSIPMRMALPRGVAAPIQSDRMVAEAVPGAP